MIPEISGEGRASGLVIASSRRSTSVRYAWRSCGAGLSTALTSGGRRSFARPMTRTDMKNRGTLAIALSCATINTT
jgi:hypothetical protein